MESQKNEAFEKEMAQMAADPDIRREIDAIMQC